jgi:hypothetical protein
MLRMNMSGRPVFQHPQGDRLNRPTSDPFLFLFSFFSHYLVDFSDRHHVNQEILRDRGGTTAGSAPLLVYVRLSSLTYPIKRGLGEKL